MSLVVTWICEHAIKNQMKTVFVECIRKHETCLHKVSSIYAAIAHLDNIMRCPALIQDITALKNAMELLEQIYAEIHVENKLIICLVMIFKIVIFLKLFQQNILSPDSIEEYFQDWKEETEHEMENTFSITEKGNLMSVMRCNYKLRLLFTKLLEDPLVCGQYIKNDFEMDFHSSLLKLQEYLKKFLSSVLGKLPPSKIERILANSLDEETMRTEISSDQDCQLLLQELHESATEENLLRIVQSIGT